ncbi:S8 family serine peptidase [Lewinella sp. W8]|uniref:S8 family serine peptidase n=1 Tax=Lewinella sp. W8 TaxID=2528208 RepID=UPI00106812BF|nr:S8 family serine peptidase [Lewinella sp. W8]MTB50988.1 S8 family serine peptidase [Lewinella sp. W8]
MKRLFLLGALCLLGLSFVQAQATYYWSTEGKISVTASDYQFIVTANEGVSLDQVRLDNVKQYESFAHKNYAVFESVRPLSADQVAATLGFDTDEIQVSPGFQYEDGFTIYPTRKIVVQLNRKEDVGAMMDLVNQYGVKAITDKNGIFRIELAQLDDAFALSNKLYESGITAFAHPDFYAPIERYQINDPLFNQQFQMNNTGQTIDGVAGQPDADCNALEAWNISLGSSSITVAVIDDGLEDHEDFNDGTGASRYIGGFTPANNGNGDAISGSNHGVACAGSIAASHNNLGVRGVAPLVKMLSVNIFFGGESTQDIADGISWAKNNGADVLSNSWGYTSCTASFSNIRNAIADADANGRGGLGSIVIFASGNGYKDCVDFPANDQNAVAVGAFANTGIRSAYSNYGSDLDIMAPSNNVGGPGAGVRTTDRMGSPGYTSGNYTSSFGGTSSACPTAAGVAALVLGYDPSLTTTALKNLLYSTAIDMGPAGVDAEYANGRINALGALQQLSGGGGGPTCDDGIQNGDETGIDCGGANCPACPPVTCNGTEVTLTIVLDNYPEETSWTITADGGGIVASGGTYGFLADGSTYTEDICLADGCYTFTINDSYGDGICCSYGNGSYSLTDGGTVLASGGAFASSEATAFCVGGGGADTEAPTTPTNLTASNITTSSMDLSWNASSDNVGVTGYNVYQGSTLLGTVTGTSATITGLAEGTTYTFSVTATDDAGNESGAASVTATTLTAGDSSPPTTPTNLAASNITTSSLDLTWNASSDNVGVTGYNVYQGSTLLGSVTGTAASITGLAEATTYTFSVTATDAAGNESGAASVTATTLSSGGGGQTETIFASFFETGWDNWNDGGSDCYRYRGSRSYEGQYSIRIRDNSGTASSMTSDPVNLTNYASVDMEFYFYPNSMENGEDFWLQYNDGSGWQTVATYASGSQFSNGSFYTSTVTLDRSQYNFSANATFRFRCDASANADQIYIDQVTLTGTTLGGANIGGDGTTVTIEQLPTRTTFDIEDESEFDIRISPNPATDLVTVRADEAIESVTVTSIDGRQLLYRKVGNVDQAQLDVSDFPAGVYLISIQTTEELLTDKVVIRR